MELAQPPAQQHDAAASLSQCFHTLRHPPGPSVSWWSHLCRRLPHHSGSDMLQLQVATGGGMPYYHYSATLVHIARDCIWRGAAIYDYDRLCASDCSRKESFHPPHCVCLLRVSKPSAATAPGDAARRRLGLSRARPRVCTLAGVEGDLFRPLEWRGCHIRTESARASGVALDERRVHLQHSPAPPPSLYPR